MAKNKLSQPEPNEVWVTLKEASERTGCSIAALRKWYRAEEIRRRTQGNQVLVELREVQQRYGGSIRRGLLDRPFLQGRSTGADEIVISAGAWADLLDEQRRLRSQLEDAVQRAARAESRVDAIRRQLK